MADNELLTVDNLVKHYPLRTGLLRRPVGQVHAVDGISFSIGRGETLALVGESGCGKTTAGKSVLRLIEPTSGRIVLNGTDISKISRAAMREHRRNLQVIFQDPYSSLNPRMSAGEIVAEPLRNYGLARGKAAAEEVALLFERVGLDRGQMKKLPHEFSGGQRQRLGIARALALRPNLIVGDEPVSALDVSVQAQVVNLMIDLQNEFGLSYLFIAHDLAVVEHISHRVGVMYLGKIVEMADKRSLFSEPLHPYTRSLLAAVPVARPSRGRRQRERLIGELPSPLNPPSGCRFHPRCPYRMPRCKNEEPVELTVAPGRRVACHLFDEGGAGRRAGAAAPAGPPGIGPGAGA